MVVGQMETSYSRDGYTRQFSAQTRAWADLVPLLQGEFRCLLELLPSSDSRTILLEFPLYRLQKRIDITLLLESAIAVIEAKVGERHFLSGDHRQVEEYALELRDFHEGSRGHLLVPVLWATEAAEGTVEYHRASSLVAPVQCVGRRGLHQLLAQIPSIAGPRLIGEAWETSAYRPVPSIIQAATTIFSGHDVRRIAQSDASNLQEAAARLVQIILEAKRDGRRALIFLTGVPGLGQDSCGPEGRARCNCHWNGAARRHHLPIRQHASRNRSSRGFGA